MASELTLPWTCVVNSTTVVNVLNPYTNPYTSGDPVPPTWSVWWLKERLKEAGWTVAQSCAITAAPSTYTALADGTDLWNASGGAFDSARFGSVTSTGNRAWIALQAPSPNSDYYFIIDLVAPTSRNSICFYIAKGPLSVGSPNTRPANLATEFGKQLPFFDTALVPHRQSLHVVPSGDYKGAFVFATSSASGAFDSVLSFNPLQSYHTGDPFPWVLFMFGTSNTLTNFDDNTSKMVLGKYAGGDTTVDGTLRGTAYTCSIPKIDVDGVVTTLFTSNTFKGRSNFDATFSEFPLLIASPEKFDIKGTLTDITLASAGAPDGGVYPPATVIPFSGYKKTKSTCFWMPWTATVSPIL